MDYLEFIARVTSHLPDKGQVMVSYFGLYANAHRGKPRRRALLPLPWGLSRRDAAVPLKGWAEMSRKVHGLKISLDRWYIDGGQVTSWETLPQ